MNQSEQVQLLGYAAELSATLEEILDIRSQYGKPSVDEPSMLKRSRYLAAVLEESLKPCIANQSGAV